LTASLRCPQCGGENPLPSGERVLRCRFCDASLFVDRSGLVSHYRLPRLLDRKQAEAALKRWMAGNETVKDLDVQARVEELAAVSFPVWMFRFQEAAGVGGVLVRPAAPTPEAGMADLEVPGGSLVPFRAAPAAEEETVAATVPLETARGWLSPPGSTPGGAAGGSAARQPTEIALVQVPFWRATYAYGGRSWTTWIEGSTGSAVASVYPAKAEAPFFLVAALGLVLFGLEGLLIVDVLWKAVAFAVTAVPMTAIAWWVASRV
jgi:hypothetical protein